jgi:hypothetical protein
MTFLIYLVITIVLAIVLHIIIIQSDNIIFILLKKPRVWIIFMGVLSFSYFFVGSLFENSFNVIWWSALFALLKNIPPQVKKDSFMSKEEINKIVDENYREMGIKGGRLKYKLGLVLYSLGFILGWLTFYSDVLSL